MAKHPEEFWKLHTDAHRIHHKIADFIINKDKREHPVGLRSLVKKYNEMIIEAEKHRSMK